MAGFIDRLRGAFGDRTAAKPFTEQGVGGFRIYGGYIAAPETNSQLMGQQRWLTAADLLANISVIAASVRYTLNLISRPHWRFEPVDDTAQAKQAAEFMESVIEDIDSSWTRIIRRAGMYRYHGFGIHEWVAKRRDDGKIGIASIESRPQHTINRWDIDENGGVSGVWQRDPMTGNELYLPRRKLLYIVDDTLTDSPDGMGWFRHLAEPARRVKSYLELESMGFERDLAGIPVGRAPLQKLNKLVEDGKITAQQREQMIDALKQFTMMRRKDKDTGLILDSTTFKGKSETGETISSVFEWGMELLTGSQNSIQELGASIERLQYEMALIMGTEAMLVGRSGQGSRALSEDKSRNLYLTANATLADMAESVNRDLVDPIWQMNGLPEELKPKAAVEDVAFKDVESIAKVLSEMATAGAILAPDDPAINDLRDLMGIEHAKPMDMGMVNALQGRSDPTKPSPDAAVAGKDPKLGPDGKPIANDNKPVTDPKAAAKAAPRTLYVHRQLLNADDLILWAKAQGFATTVPGAEMHVTQCYSRQPVDWMKIEPADPWLCVSAGGPRIVEPLGDKGAVVLLFRSADLEARHAELLADGASHDFPDYHCHVTITYDGAGMDLEKIEPYRGTLDFGPELFSELNEDWKDGITEKGLSLRLSGFDESKHPRDKIGRWADAAGAMTENPLNPNELLTNGGDASEIPLMGDPFAADATPIGGLTVRDAGDGWHLSEVRSINRGGGQVAMRHLTRLADQHGKKITLFAVPLDSPGGLKMSSSRLRQWYAGFGFERQGKTDYMVRQPKPVRKGGEDPDGAGA